MTDSRGAFSTRLKAAREAKGITIDQIAASTKISASLLDGLERGDVSRWPGGLFRRSYVRDYARMIGLQPDQVVAEFVRLFPHPNDDTPAGEPHPDAAPHEPTPLTMTLADDRSGRVSRRRARVAAAAIDVAIVAGVSAASALALPLDPGPVVAGVAVAYHAAATIAFGRTVGARWTGDRRLTQWRRRAGRPATAEAPPPEPAPTEDPPPKALPSASTA